MTHIHNMRKARAYCLKLLSVRNRTIKEVMDKLSRKGYNGEACRVIEELKSKGFLNDISFAEEWIEERLRTSPRSFELIGQELERKGVKRAVIDKVLCDPALPSNAEIAGALVRKKIKEPHRDTGQRLKARVFRFLAGRGFDPETAEEAISLVVRD